MVVTATRGGERSAEDLPVSTTVITRQELEASPITTIDEVLRTIPGVQLPVTNSHYSFPVAPSVSMRGLGLGYTATRTLVLLDGVPMNGPFFGNVYWNRVPKYNVDRIEVVRGTAYSGFRAPTLAELYRTFGTSTFIGRANANLKPEPLIAGEVGFDLDFSRYGFNGQVNGFYNTVDDFVGSVVVAEEPFTLQNANLGRIRSRGVEIFGTKQLWVGLSLTTNSTFADSTVVKDSELQGNWVEGAPRHVVTGNLTCRPSFGLTVDVRGRYLTKQFQDISNETKLGPHAVFDVAATYAVNRYLKVFFLCENLLDREYAASNFGGITSRGLPLQAFGGLRFRLG
jgi:outer membrane cobalamin receptor